MSVLFCLSKIVECNLYIGLNLICLSKIVSRTWLFMLVMQTSKAGKQTSIRIAASMLCLCEV